METKKEIEVTVVYVGNPDWNHRFPPETLVGTVKVEAMKLGFHIEASAADKYVLQEDGADVADNKPLSDFHKEHLKFELILINEPHKGS